MVENNPTKIVCAVFVAGLLLHAAQSLAQDTPNPPMPENVLPAASPAGDNADLLNMKLDDLAKQNVVVPGLSTEVSTVERQTSTIGRSPNAVFVITPEMIKRSGARSIPDALRIAPGVQVARITSDTWAISIRGFNERFASKLLVQIDGRVVYNSSFGGVHWNQQDVVLPDIERIEVIRGPGTTMWGSNAVNGVINIITKKSSDTQGLLVQSGGGGEQERDFNTVRYGGRHNENFAWRVYGKEFNRDASFSEQPDINDGWRQNRGGFRMDFTPTKQDTLTVQGDVFRGNVTDSLGVSTPFPPFIFPPADPYPPVYGGNILARYSHVIDEDTSWQIQSFYDRYSTLTNELAETQDLYDIDFQYQFSPREFHHVIVGTNYRNTFSEHIGGFTVSALHNNSTTFMTEWASVFAQDTMTLEEDRWYFTLGSRLEQNTLGGFQVEPTARLLFLPSDRQSVWAAVSRAVRNPTQLDTHILTHAHVGPPNVPTFIHLMGDPNFQPENLLSYEIGYRVAPTDKFTWDIAGYINDYRKLRGVNATEPPFVVPPGLVYIPVTFSNDTHAISYGFETTATLQMSQDWRLYTSYSVFEVNAQGSEPGASLYNGSNPNNQVNVRSSWDLSDNLQFDLTGRYVDRLVYLGVPSYFETDARIAWQARKNLEFSFVGMNLMDDHHFEFVDTTTHITPTEVRRSWYAMMTWTY
jgi:iron complex outermembrane recepter protein